MVDPEIMKWLEEWINNPEQVDRLTHWQTSDLCKLLTDFAASREQAIADQAAADMRERARLEGRIQQQEYMNGKYYIPAEGQTLMILRAQLDSLPSKPVSSGDTK